MNKIVYSNILKYKRLNNYLPLLSRQSKFSANF